MYMVYWKVIEGKTVTPHSAALFTKQDAEAFMELMSSQKDVCAVSARYVKEEV
jgi:hypothetical protein